MTDRETRGCPILPPPVPVLDTAARRAVLGRHPRTSHARSGEARARASVGQFAIQDLVEETIDGNRVELDVW